MSNIKFNLDIPKIGDFILYQKPKSDFFGNQIKKEQLKKGFSPKKAEFTHIETSWGGPQAVSVVPPKTKIIDITKAHKGRYVRIVRYHKYKGNRERYRVALWSTSLANLGYDWFGVLKFRIRFLFHSRGKFFCSENAAWALTKEFEDAFGDLKPYQIMPAHFLGEEFDLVWEGIIE